MCSGHYASSRCAGGSGSAGSAAARGPSSERGVLLDASKGESDLEVFVTVRSLVVGQCHGQRVGRATCVLVAGGHAMPHQPAAVARGWKFRRRQWAPHGWLEPWVAGGERQCNDQLLPTFGCRRQCYNQPPANLWLREPLPPCDWWPLPPCGWWPLPPCDWWPGAQLLSSGGCWEGGPVLRVLESRRSYSLECLVAGGVATMARGLVAHAKFGAP
eukprot:365878-Chlamydomonas_euryale.AAC.1